MWYRGSTVLQTVATYNYTVIAARLACIAGVSAGVLVSSVEDNKCTNPQLSVSAAGDKVPVLSFKNHFNIPSFFSSTLWNRQNPILLRTYRCL